MPERPVVSSSWQAAEIEGSVAADASRIVFGTFMPGRGTSWYDELVLEVQTGGAWARIEIQDAGFEDAGVAASWKPGNGTPRLTSTSGWRVELDHEAPAAGSSALRVAAATAVIRDELFEGTPRPGETVELELGDGRRARVPLTLYSREGHTLGDGSPSSSSVPAGPFDMYVGLADVIVTWNAIEHFWPSWGDVPSPT